jgi:pyridoxal 5'-phosphate synthase pdxT subunit
MKIGVLALQGDFLDHQVILEGLGVEALQVRLAHQLDSLDGLIIPGGESTTMGKLAVDFGLLEPLRQFGRRKAVWGTCAGTIFLSDDVHCDQPVLGLMNISVERNAFGRQIDSFEIDLDIPSLLDVSEEERPFHAIFIRAPLIDAVHDDVDVLANLPDGAIVAAQQGHLLATSFHPELTGDDRIHRYFLRMVK